MVILLYRPGMYDEGAGVWIFPLIAAKNRNGPTGTVDLAFRGWHARCDEIEWTPGGSIPLGAPDPIDND